MKIKELITKIWNKIHKLFDQTNEELKKYIPIAINVVEAIKKFNESASADLIEYVVETAIPGSADDIIIKRSRSITREWLPKVLVELKIAGSIVQLEKDSDKLKAFLTELKLTSTKGIIYKGIAGKFLEKASDGDVSFDDAIALTSDYFLQLQKAKQNEAANLSN